MDFAFEFVNRSDETIAEYIEQVRQSDLPQMVKTDVIHILETVRSQCHQAHDMGWF